MIRISTGLMLLMISVSALGYAVPSWLFHRAIRVYSDPEAYRVYAAILPENPGYRYASSTVIFRQQTRAYFDKDCFKPVPKYEALEAPAIADYFRVNRVPWKLARLFPIDKPYELAPETDFAGFWWKPSSPLGEYIRKQPEFPGIIELSAVGFNETKTVAVLYMTYKRPGGGWNVVVLRKEKEGWKQVIRGALGCFGKS